MEKIIELFKEHLKIVVLILIGLLAGGIFYVTSQAKIPENTLSVNHLTAESSTASAEMVRSNEPDKSTTEITVDLKGAVVKPNVYKLSTHARMNELIKIAGGFLPEADQNSINLAAKLKDEEVVYVAKIGENAAPADSESSTKNLTSSSNMSETTKININTADLTQLQTLSGIGAKKAQDIIDYRTQNGNFKSIEELGKVSGFGEKTIAKLKESITVD